jgi:hypothetical protein
VRTSFDFALLPQRSISLQTWCNLFEPGLSECIKHENEKNGFEPGLSECMEREKRKAYDERHFGRWLGVGVNPDLRGEPSGYITCMVVPHKARLSRCLRLPDVD